ncbi:MAG TPA: hypothetical protein VGN11_01265 [Candidatus Baltobacteraceae bacterium]|jgi:hypothetical protein|nr:hypothetical protein [Candidatus Baltobacteraceae bacterium]
MSFLLKWLRLDTSARVGLRPHRNVAMELGFDAAYERCLSAIDGTLGASVYIDDRAGRLIEAGFGLINNERIRVSFDLLDATHTVVRVEAFFPAGAAILEKSAAVDALAVALERSTSA